jgi:hypothetical protein
MMRSPLEFSDGKTADQLAKFIRLVFISDQPGEIANSIAAVRRLLASENRDAHWLAERLVAPVQSEPELDVGKSTIWWCFHRRHLRAGKGGQQRGTSRREDVLDTSISLRRPADYSPAEGARFEVHYEKHRGFYGADAEPFEAKLEMHNGTAVVLRRLAFGAFRHQPPFPSSIDRNFTGERRVAGRTG